MKNVSLKFYEIIKSIDLNIKHILMDILTLLFDRCLALGILTPLTLYLLLCKIKILI